MRGDQAQQLAADIARGSKDGRPNHGGALFTDCIFMQVMCIIMRMSDLKERRQRAIADLIRGDASRARRSSPSVWGPRLRRHPGDHFARPRADRRGQGPPRRSARAMRFPISVRERRQSRLAAVFRDWVRSIDSGWQLVVIKTPPGSAHLVGVALDAFELAGDRRHDLRRRHHLHRLPGFPAGRRVDVQTSRRATVRRLQAA